MATRSKSARRRLAAPLKSAKRRAAIRIRMYRVGFGDCFLVSLPVAGGFEHILIDCGVHARGDIGTMQAAVSDIATETQGKIALVIATHAHQDHISGFADYEETFRQLQIGEVWLPWTENPKDRVAVRLKQKQNALVHNVAAHLAARPAAPEARAAVAAALENLSGNDRALRLLKDGINEGVVRYVQAGQRRDDIAGIRGFSAQVLGPPRDQKFLARMDPPANERFFRASPDGELESVNDVLAFESKWHVPPESNPFYAALTERDKNLLSVAATTDVMGLAFALDRVMNNTSIVALLAYAGKTMVFPGDAQFGSWESWMESDEAQELLGNISFYKVAHHGSHNGTPKSIVERLPEKRFAAMVSTQSEPWASIPLSKLMTALSERASAVIRSDSLKVTGAPKGPPLGPLPEGCTPGKFWIDYCIPVKLT